MRYLIRSIKFLVALFVIYLAAVWIMIEAGASMLTMRETLQVLVHTTRGIVLIVAIVVWAAVYPRIGFVSRRDEGDMTEDRERIIAAFISAGYVLRSEDGEQMRFRAAGLFHKLRCCSRTRLRFRSTGSGSCLTAYAAVSPTCRCGCVPV